MIHEYKIFWDEDSQEYIAITLGNVDYRHLSGIDNNPREALRILMESIEIAEEIRKEVF